MRALVLALALPGLALAQTRPEAVRPVLQAAPRGTESIRVDGRLDEAAWAAAPATEGFTQQAPVPNAAPSEASRAWVLYDASALYVGARLDDREADRIEAPLARRDADAAGDWFSVGLDPYQDRRTGYVFLVNPAGVQRDAVLYDDYRRDLSWDAVWESATVRDSAGWTVEMRIPLSKLRFPSDADQRWGLQFRRRIGRTGEWSIWSLLDSEIEAFASQFGTLDGLRGLRPPRHIDVRPYAATRLTRAPGDLADPFYRANDVTPTAGLDAQIGLTRDLTLTATLNPDFGQVEADPARVNLTAFELAFDERRPFFVEGTDVFSFGRIEAQVNLPRPTLLYTRRIGRSPQRTRFAPTSGTVYTDVPEVTTILGAGKLTGRVGGVAVGVLDAVTAPEYGRFSGLDGDPEAGRALVEPLTNYVVGRAQGGRGATTLGGLVTAVHRHTDDPEVRDLLGDAAYAVGLDGQHGWGDWMLTGYAAGSHVTGTPDAVARLQTASTRYLQRPDAGHLAVDSARTHLSGLDAHLSLAKVGGANWIGTVRAMTTTPGFEVNALGFQTRADIAAVAGALIYRDIEADATFRYWYTSLFGRSGWNYAGDRVEGLFGWVVRPVFRSGAALRFVALLDGGRADDRLTRGGPLARQPLRFGLEHEGTTDAFSQRPLSLEWLVYGARDRAGQTSAEVSAGARLRPSPAVEVTVGPSLRLDHAAQYVTTVADPAASTFGARYVFGDLDQATASIDTQINWTLSTDLSLQLFVRPFVSSGTYSRFKELAAPGTFAFTAYGEDRVAVERSPEAGVRVTPGDGGVPFAFADPDFRVRSFQGNAVLRWEYRPGSTLFLVWQQRRSGTEAGGRLGGLDVVRALGDPVENVVLVKVSYRLAP